MSERIPSTEEVRSWAAYVPTTTTQMRWSDREAAAFDRWLAAHDEEVRAEERDRITRNRVTITMEPPPPAKLTILREPCPRCGLMR